MDYAPVRRAGPGWHGRCNTAATLTSELDVPDVLCFSHLRWNFVFQRPNHLMSQCANDRRVFFVEEPRWIERSGSAGSDGELELRRVGPQLYVVTPQLLRGSDAAHRQRELLEQMYEQHDIRLPIHWFYTPMALEFARDLPARLTVYDCMDELSGFRGAPPALQTLERELFRRARLVFTGGRSLFEAKRRLHADVHLFPSSVDVEHYRAARRSPPDPADQLAIPRPRLGYFGVIDERLDLELIERIARERPDWSVILLGPVVKIDPGTLPRLPNIHYLGQKGYEELPGYLAGWQVALMPFALNESTRFISPTKTLEYLAGGKAVVSTPIRDVISPYAEQGLVQVAERDAFVTAIERALAGRASPDPAEVDAMLARTSWAQTWSEMAGLIEGALRDDARPTESRSARA
jgi:glycosyltransferase involved in cell wall biosynthesis